MANFQRAFEKADVDANGRLGRNEFIQVCKKSLPGINNHDIAILMHEIDQNGNGAIEYKVKKSTIP